MHFQLFFRLLMNDVHAGRGVNAIRREGVTVDDNISAVHLDHEAHEQNPRCVLNIQTISVPWNSFMRLMNKVLNVC